MKYFILTLISTVWSLTALSQKETFLLTNIQTEKEILDVTQVLHSEEILDSIVTRVIVSSNLLKAIDQEIMMYDEEILQNKRSWISSFRLGVNVFSANTSLDQTNESVTTYGLLPNVGLNLSIDPEKLVNRKSYMRQSANKREYSRFIKADSRQTLKKDILNHYYDYLSLLETVNIRQLGYETRKQQEEFLNSSFRNGEASYSELLIAENQVHLAKESWMSASINAMKKRSEISVLIGLK
ncbi:MAG: TolC family protein [Marinoscillum sp.]